MKNSCFHFPQIATSGHKWKRATPTNATTPYRVWHLWQQKVGGYGSALQKFTSAVGLQKITSEVEA